MTSAIKTNLWARAASRIVGKEKSLTLEKRGIAELQQVSDLIDFAS